MGKTPSSHIIHWLGGEYCSIVRDSEPIRLLKSPRSLSVYILINYDTNIELNITEIDKKNCLSITHEVISTESEKKLLIHA